MQNDQIKAFNKKLMHNKNDTQLMAELNKEKIYTTLNDFKQELIGIEDVVATQTLEQLSQRGDGNAPAMLMSPDQEPRLRYREERDREKVPEENPRIEKDISTLEKSLRGTKVFEVEKSNYNNNLIESKRLSMGSIMMLDDKSSKNTTAGGTTFLPSVENIHKFMGQSMVNFSTANKLNHQVNSPLKISAHNIFASSSNRYGSQEMNKSFL